MSDYTREQLARYRADLAVSSASGARDIAARALDALEAALAEIERIHLHNANVLQLINDAAHKLKSSIAHLAEDNTESAEERLEEAVEILMKATQSFADRR
jgi:capsule polysaccharide export protein KpsE/RkpR